MTMLERQRCFNHAHREAAARCVECGRFYCRECVTEHDRRVVCARCLQLKTTAKKKDRSLIGAAGRGIAAAAGLLLLWVMFVLLAQILLAVPDDFHEGRVWKTNYWLDE